eukprot:TRINITY_DN3135_c0_g1_i4.p1 TRINITY_DN3135_c0_g1~~TRINITY_DN3135_c0_g1_i4.p1  ORF type:complete len:411 (-),score=30.81 TRINITY_DN3135_c0_g1_i4:253-1485(-)
MCFVQFFYENKEKILSSLKMNKLFQLVKPSRPFVKCISTSLRISLDLIEVKEQTQQQSHPSFLVQNFQTKECMQYLQSQLNLPESDILVWNKKSGSKLLQNDKDTLVAKINLITTRLECDIQTVTRLLRRSAKMFNPSLEELQQQIDFWLNDVKCRKGLLRLSASFWIKPLEEINQFCAELQNKGFENPKAILHGFPKIVGFSQKEIDQKLVLVQQLLQLQNQSDARKVFERNSKIFQVSKGKFEQVFLWFEKHSFQRQEVCRIIEKDPEILDLSIDKLKRGWDQLLEFCKGSETSVRRIVAARPSNLALNTNSESLQKKLNFLKNQLDIDPVDVLENVPRISHFSIETRIAPRILFLKFKQQIDNQDLQQILLASDDEFVQNIGNCPLTEYQNFISSEARMIEQAYNQA